MQTIVKKTDKNWADLAEDLKGTVDKAYPELQDEAREILALNKYLSLLDNLQVAFGVRQRNPETLDAAVSATLELESYLSPKQTAVSSDEAEQRPSEKDNVVDRLYKLVGELDGESHETRETKRRVASRQRTIYFCS